MPLLLIIGIKSERGTVEFTGYIYQHSNTLHACLSIMYVYVSLRFAEFHLKRLQTELDRFLKVT